MRLRDLQDHLDPRLRMGEPSVTPHRCPEFQADGVPCPDPARDCERCARAAPPRSTDHAPSRRVSHA